MSTLQLELSKAKALDEELKNKNAEQNKLLEELKDAKKREGELL